MGPIVKQKLTFPLPHMSLGQVTLTVDLPDTLKFTNWENIFKTLYGGAANNTLLTSKTDTAAGAKYDLMGFQ